MALVDIYNQGTNKTTWQRSTIFCFIQFQSQNLVFYLPRISVDKCRNISHVKSNRYTYLVLVMKRHRYRFYIPKQEAVSGCY